KGCTVCIRGTSFSHGGNRSRRFDTALGPQRAQALCRVSSQAGNYSLYPMGCYSKSNSIDNGFSRVTGFQQSRRGQSGFVRNQQRACGVSRPRQSFESFTANCHCSDNEGCEGLTPLCDHRAGGGQPGCSDPPYGKSTATGRFSNGESATSGNRDQPA